MVVNLLVNFYNSVIMNYNGVRYKVLIILDNSKYKYVNRVIIRKFDYGFFELVESFKNCIFYYFKFLMNNFC